MKIKFPLGSKILLMFVLLIGATMAAVSIAVYKIVSDQLTGQYEQELHVNLQALERGLEGSHDVMSSRLSALVDQITDDNEFRMYLTVLNRKDQPYIINYTSLYMESMGLDALEILNSGGTIISSAHSLYEYGGSHDVVKYLSSAEDFIRYFINFENKSGNFWTLGAADSFFLGGEKYFILGGIRIDSLFLRNFLGEMNDLLFFKTDSQIISSGKDADDDFIRNYLINYSDDSELPAKIKKRYAVAVLPVQTIEEKKVREGHFFYFRSRQDLLVLTNRLGMNIFSISAAAVLMAILLAGWITRSTIWPLRELADKAGEISLERLNVHFNVKSRDEVGVLARTLQKMVSRLRHNRIRLAAAQENAARADMAAQVNHDIKNGFIPIRNVLQHWEEAANQSASKLQETFLERKMNVWKSLKYLEDLTKQYSRFQTREKPAVMDVNELLKNLIKQYMGYPEEKTVFSLDLSTHSLPVKGGVNQLHRAFENILVNAIEAVGEAGEITVRSYRENDKIIVEWQDTGPGIAESIREKIFREVVSTKPGGTGIGLLNVQRIIRECNGKIELTSRPSEGTSIIITFPVAKEMEKGESQF